MRIKEIFRKDKNQQINPLEWWAYKDGGLGIKHSEEYFTSPFCEYAEIYYLLMLIALRSVYKNSPKKVRKYCQRQEVCSNDKSRKITALVLHKQSIIENLFDIFYYFGEQTFLVLTTELAGTIRSKDIMGPIYAWRPLTHNPEWVKKALITLPRIILGGNVVSMQGFVKEALFMIDKYGYTGTITMLIKDLGLDFNSEAFVRNSKMPVIDRKKISLLQIK